MTRLLAEETLSLPRSLSLFKDRKAYERSTSQLRNTKGQWDNRFSCLETLTVEHKEFAKVCEGQPVFGGSCTTAATTGLKSYLFNHF